MAEPPKTPTKAETRVCRTCNENIVVKNHPWDLFGAKASQENIPSVLERFFELKVALNDGLPSYICTCCHHNASVNSTCAQAPPRATAGHLHALSVPGVGHLQILHCPGAGHSPTPGPFPRFWHARGFLSEYDYTEGFTGKKADWLIYQGPSRTGINWRGL